MRLSLTQPNLRLYHSPGACSQVSVFALEQAGLAYELERPDQAEP